MKIKETRKEYTNGEVTIVWQPALCIHSENCWRGLPEVFRYKQKPWVDPEGATTDQITAQIDKCPSGALSYYMNGENSKEGEEQVQSIDILDDGPVKVKGPVTIRYNGEEITRRTGATLCRCGASENKPFCDGSHKKIEFKG